MRKETLGAALAAALMLAACGEDARAPQQPEEPAKIDDCDVADGTECK